MTGADVMKRLAALEAAHAKMGEQLAAFRAEAEGAASEGKQIRALLQTFCDLWAKRYNAKYVVHGPKDTAILKRLLKVIEPDDITRRVRLYLADSSPFACEARHSLGVFAARVNQYAAVTDAGGLFDDDAPAVPGCRHIPPCRDDAAHTTRKMQETRDGR